MVAVLDGVFGAAVEAPGYLRPLLADFYREAQQDEILLLGPGASEEVLEGEDILGRPSKVYLCNILDGRREL